jgi:hypothetical protein
VHAFVHETRRDMLRPEETQKAWDDFIPSVCRGQRGDRRLSETEETYVVWLITQRRLATPRRAGTWPERGATASRKPASGSIPRGPLLHRWHDLHRQHAGWHPQR